MSAPLELTDEQKAVVAADDGLLAITALAGTGKTSTLKYFAKKRALARMLYLAFNRTLAEEAKRSLADCPNVEVRTIHSLAYKFVGHKYRDTLGSHRPLDLSKFLDRDPFENSYQLARILSDILNSYQLSAQKTVEAYIKKEARSFYPSLALAMNCPLERKKTLKRTLALLGQVAQEVWEAMQNRRFPITHNGYLKLFQLDPRELNYDYILVDEAQDLNDCMIDLIISNQAKKILVGDPFQQIYEWNGAVNALKKTSDGAAIYYLTHSFRCPDWVAQKANQVLKLLSAPKNFTGLTTPRPRKKEPVAMIARTTFGIFKFAVDNFQKFRLAYNGGLAAYEFDMVKDIYYLKNGQIKSLLSSFIKNFDHYDKLVNYADQSGDVQLKSKIRLVDCYNSQIIPLYDQLVKNEARPPACDYILSTAHRVKGQEFGEVVMAEDFIDLPSLCYSLDEARKKFYPGKETNRPAAANFEPIIFQAEEIRLIYVAITRTFGGLAMPGQYNFSDHFLDTFKSLKKDGWLKLI
ncbi:MAG: UvrD-helicase domain-containing protein [Deltaproteobacteria bacterium]|nr:UvrD-helicase domain-containing protein [Deltaproteobacteria bacterium]